MSDYRTTIGEPLPESKQTRKRQRRKWIKRIGIAMAVVILAGFLIPIRVRIAASGFITSYDYAEVRPLVAAPIATPLGDSGDTVVKGDLLVSLEDRAILAARDEARYAKLQAEARLARRSAELAQEKRLHEHQLKEAQLKVNHAQTSLLLTEELHTRGLSSGRALEEQRTMLALAEATLERIRDFDPALAEKELEELRREIDVRKSTLMRTEAELQSRHITAPISGTLVKYDFAPGEMVHPDRVLYEIFGGEHLILKLRIPERHATRVSPGDLYKATLSTYKGMGRHRFKGTLTSLRPVIQSDSQHSYRMAYCSFDSMGMDVPPGTSAEARITVGSVPLWFWLLGIR